LILDPNEIEKSINIL